VAILSRLPVGPVTSYRHLKFKDAKGREMSFHRDLLQARIEPPGAPAFDVFAIHLKSKGGGEAEETLAVRMGEARQIRAIFDELLARDAEARFVLCGDYNDTLDSEPVLTIIGQGSGKLKCLADALPEADRITYNKEPYRSMIDFIMASPGMAAHYRKDTYRIFQGDVSSIGSDHNPLSATFDLK
jgi:endonuclease/exonuclease/phosphatase family metal-dependent hydrolase